MTAPPPGSLLASAGQCEQVITRCLNETEPEHHARDMVAHILPRLGLSDVFEAELAVNELVANARQHAPGPYELRLYLAETGVKIAVVDGGGDHEELAERLLQTAAEQPTAEESGRGLQLVAGMFPGRCGAEPTTTRLGLTPAKQLWIIVAVDRDLWKEYDVAHLNETQRQAIQLGNDIRERIDRWLTERRVQNGSLAVTPYVDPKAGPSILISANAHIVRALVMSLDDQHRRSIQPPEGPAQDGWPYPESNPPGLPGPPGDSSPPTHRPTPIQ